MKISNDIINLSISNDFLFITTLFKQIKYKQINKKKKSVWLHPR